MNLHAYEMMPAPSAHKPVGRRRHNQNNWWREWEHPTGKFPTLTPHQRKVAMSRRAWQRGWMSPHPFINQAGRP